MPIKIDFLSNVRDLIRGTDDVETALDDVADSLDDMARDAKTGGREAERAVEKLEDSFRDAARRAKDLGDAGDKAGDDVKRGMRRAEDGVEEFRDEANSTARESAASFDGSAESIGDAIQEIAANAFAGFGPAGAVAGLAAAAGIGLAMAGFENLKESEEESKKRAGEWAQAYVEAGGKVLTAATTTAKALAIATDPDTFEQAKTNAKNWGVDVSVAVAAMAGEKWALKAADDALVDTERKLNDEMKNVGIQYPELTGKLTDMWSAASTGRGELERINGEMSRGGEMADAYSNYLAHVADNTVGATTVTDEFGDSVTSLPDGTTVYIDAETGQATVNVDAIEGKIYGIPDGSAAVHVDTSPADRSIREFVGRKRTITVDVVQGGVAAALKGWDR